MCKKLKCTFFPKIKNQGIFKERFGVYCPSSANLKIQLNILWKNHILILERVYIKRSLGTKCFDRMVGDGVRGGGGFIGESFGTRFFVIVTFFVKNQYKKMYIDKI